MYVLPISSSKHSRANGDRKSTRLNSSHANISYAVFCLKKTQSPAIHTRYYHILRHTDSYTVRGRRSCHGRSAEDISAHHRAQYRGCSPLIESTIQFYHY